MATRFLTRSQLMTTINQSLISSFSRSISSSSFSTPSYLSHHRLSPLVNAASNFRQDSSSWPAVATGFRVFPTRRRCSSSAINDPNPNKPDCDSKEALLFNGVDYEHWFVVVDKPKGNPTRDELIDSYIKTLAKVLGSEEEARKKIYSVYTNGTFAFGALLSEEISKKLTEVENVLWVPPDAYEDVENKKYGGEPFINGEAVPYDPKYYPHLRRVMCG